MRLFRSAIVAAAMTMTLATGQAQAEVTLKYGHPNPNESVAGRFADRFAELVKEKTAGEVIIEVYPSSQLGTAKERFEGVQFGLIDFGHDSYSTVSQAIPEFGALDLPYLYRDVAHAVAATTPATSPVLRELNERLKSEAQIEVIGSYLYGIRELTTSNFPVYKPEDLSGKRIRAIPVPVWIGMVEGMGAIPTPIDFSELTTALATGVIDGQENPLTTILTSNMYDTQEYLIMTDHMINIIPLFVNSGTLARLTEEQQAAVHESAQQAGAEILEISIAEHEQLQSELVAEGMNLINEANGLDLAAFRNRVSEHVRAKFPEWASIIDDIQAIE